MRFALLPGALPDGYGDSILPLASAKLRLRVDHDEDDELIAVLRDAAVDLVEKFTGLYLAPRPGCVWVAEAFADVVKLGVRPVSAITAVAYLDSDGAAQTATASDYRVEVHDRVVPKPSKAWPSDAAAGCRITFDAGFEEGECPPALIEAVGKLLVTFYDNREAVIIGTISSEMPLGVAAICAQFRHWNI